MHLNCISTDSRSAWQKKAANESPKMSAIRQTLNTGPPAVLKTSITPTSTDPLLPVGVDGCLGCPSSPGHRHAPNAHPSTASRKVFSPELVLQFARSMATFSVLNSN